MNKAIWFPLGVLIVIALVMQSVAVSGIEFDNSSMVIDDFSATVNGSEYDIEGQTLTVGIDDELGVLAVLISIFAFVGLIGITAVTVGLNSESVRFIGKGSAYLSVWGLFSALSLEGLSQIPLLGWVCYIFITMVYLVGIFMEI